MTDKDSSPRITALQELEAALDEHRRTQAEAGASAHADAPEPRRRRWGLRRPGWRLPFNPWSPFDRRHPVMRGITIGIAALVVLVLIGGGALWWRLSSGPIMLDLATPWLTSAIEQNLGSRYRVEVGGTQLERDAQGHTALRLRDIVLRDATGAPVAVAPKAEVGISGTSLLFASPRAKSIRLVDANMTIRIDPDGRVNVLVGGDRPFATIAPRTCAADAAATSAQPQPHRRPRTGRASGQMRRTTSRCRRWPNAASRRISRRCWPGSTSRRSWSSMAATPAPAASTAMP